MDEQQAGGLSWSGVLQSLTNTATGYLDRRIDIDLQTRLADRLAPRMASTQTPINQYAPQQVFGISASTLVPLLLLGAVAFVALRR